MCLVVWTYFPLATVVESLIYLKAVYKYLQAEVCRNVEMSPNCSILASIFQKFPGGHAPKPP